MSLNRENLPINKTIVILILGALTAISPFSIDMYLPAFPEIAADMHSSVPSITLSVSSYFIGMALGQVFYGPLLDRFGRKKPLYIGLAIYIIASIACMNSWSVMSLVGFRFIQALGGCVAGVAAMAMVRDFFPVKESAKVFSLLILILGTSPLLAPTIGGLIAVHLGWKWVFIMLSIIVVSILSLVHFYLPEGHTPDHTISLRLKPIVRVFADIFKNKQFFTYALSGAFLFSGLFVYVAASPIIFMNILHVSATIYGAIFAFLASGFIGGSQFNIVLLKKYSNEKIYRVAMICQAVIMLIFLISAIGGYYNLYSIIILTFAFLTRTGIANPNGAALALAPFEKNAGSASALLGFLQTGIGALVSTAVGLLNAAELLPIICILAVTSWIGLAFIIRKKTELQLAPMEI